MSYVKTLTRAVELAGVVGGGVHYLVDHADDIKQSIDKLASMLLSAKTLVSTANDVANMEPVKSVLKREASPDDKPSEESEALAPEGESQARKPVQTWQQRGQALLQGAAERATAFRDERMEGVNQWKLERELRKQVHDAKKTVLENANIKMPLTKLVEQLNSDDDVMRLARMGVLDASGCFVIATYPKIDLDKDSTSYQGIYVGKAACVGDGIAEVVEPTGNADVYADIKYRQNVWVYVFTCAESRLDEKHAALMDLLEARESYNRFSVDQD